MCLSFFLFFLSLFLEGVGLELGLAFFGVQVTLLLAASVAAAAKFMCRDRPSE